MRKQDRRLALLSRLVRVSGWISASDVYDSFGILGGGVAHNRIAQTLRRAVLAGFVEVDASLWPRRYRITEAGRAEAAVLSDPLALERRKAEWGAKRSAKRLRPGTVAA